MEVKPGYKQTEVGVIPEDWETSPLGDLVEAASPICYGVVQVGHHTEDGVPIIAIKYVKEIAHAPLHRAATLIERPYSRSRIKADDVLVSIKGTIGRVGVVPPGFKGNISRELARLRLCSGYLPAYVAQQLECDATQYRITSAVVGTTRLEFSIAILRRFEIPIPASFAEQEAIAGALSDADALIESLEQLVAKKRQIKHGAMQELLTGQKRLPGFTGEWVTTRLGDLGHWMGGMTHSMSNSHYWTAGTIPWISSGDVKVVRLTTTAFSITALAVKDRTTNLLPAGAIVIVTRSGILRKYLPVAMNMVPMAINQDIKALLPNEGVDPEYVLHSVSAHGDQILASCLKSGTTVESIEFPWLKTFTIPLPPTREEQTAIAAVLSDMDAEIGAVETRLAKARQVKQGMMQELLTGRIRLV